MKCVYDYRHSIEYAMVDAVSYVTPESTRIVEEQDFGFQAWEGGGKDTPQEHLSCFVSKLCGTSTTKTGPSQLSLPRLRRMLPSR